MTAKGSAPTLSDLAAHVLPETGAQALIAAAVPSRQRLRAAQRQAIPKAGEDPDELNRSAWADLDTWLAECGLEMVIHRDMLHPPRLDRWVGVVPSGGRFSDHCLVMVRNTLLFDPTPHVGLFRRFGIRDIRWGFSFQGTSKRQRKERKRCQVILTNS